MKLPKGSQESEAWVELDDVETKVTVIYSHQGAEPDVGVEAGTEIEGVWIGDLDVTGQLTEVQLEDIANDINDMAISRAEAYEEDYDC